MHSDTELGWCDSQCEDRHVDSSYEEEGTLDGIYRRLQGTQTGVLGFPARWVHLTSFMDPRESHRHASVLPVSCLHTYTCAYLTETAMSY